MKDGGGYAFPNEHPGPERGPDAARWHTGMTLRQYYKAQAEPSMMFAWFTASDSERKVLSDCVDSATIMQRDLPLFAAKVAGLIADAMIAEDKDARETVSEKEPEKVEGPATELTTDCPGCGNFFTPESPEDKMCKECLQQEVEEAHDAGECVENCPICADEGRGRKGEENG